VLGPLDFLAQQEPSNMLQFVDRLARTPISAIVWVGVVGTVVRLGLAHYLKTTPRHLRTGLYTMAKIVNEISDAVVYAAIVVFMLVRPFGIQTFNIPTGSMVSTINPGEFIVANKWVYRTSDPKRFDIVVFKPPPYALFPGQPSDTSFIKRLIGLPGDTVEWKDKRLYINGQEIPEPWVDYTDNTATKVLPKEQWASVISPNFKLVKDKDQYVPVQYAPDALRYPDLVSSSVNAPMSVTAAAAPFTPPIDDKATRLRWLEAPPAAVPPGHYLFMGDNRNGSFDGRGWGLVKREDIIAKSWFIFLPIHRWGLTN
jgi:signal peptidase I